MNRKMLVLTLTVGFATLIGAYAARGPLGRAATPGASAGIENCHELIDHFTDYPIVYLGDEFEGMPLTYCDHVQTPPTESGIPATDFFVLIYGDCTPTGGDHASCPAPLQLTIDPGCAPAPVPAASAPSTLQRGLEVATLSNGHAYADAAAFKLTVSVNYGPRADRDATASRVIDAVRGANGAAAGIAPGAPLRAQAQPVGPCVS
jgi:hypothetical protein